MTVEEAGELPGAGGAENVNIDVLYSLVMPTTAQRYGKGAGVMYVTISVETQAARVNWRGVNPSSTTGIYLPAPGVYVFKGEKKIAAMKLISAVAGSVINYGFSYSARG